MKPISEHIAQTAVDFFNTDLSAIPENVVLEAKRSLLDSIAVTVGGYGAPVSNIVLGWVSEMGGREEATIVGSGLKVPVANAALANGTMLRYLDYMDSYGNTVALKNRVGEKGT